MNFEYIKQQYKVPAEMFREVIVDGKKGVISKDMGNYIGVNFYSKRTAEPLPCHPTWEVKYLETFNHDIPIKKMTASQKRYKKYLSLDLGCSFKEYLKIKTK